MGELQIPGKLARVLSDVAAERVAQDALWGVQEFPDGTGPAGVPAADRARQACRDAWNGGELTWRHILAEEFAEALAEDDLGALRGELVQTAAVAVKWIQSLDRRRGFVRHRPGRGVRMEKLVRDGVPELIRAEGGDPDVRVAGESEYVSLLRNKLYEEAGEYAAGGDVDELADVLEVLHALARTHGAGPADLEARRAAKQAERGGFEGRRVLGFPAEEVPEPPEVLRHSVRGLVLDGEDLLLFRRTRPGSPVYWTTPGGGIEPTDADPVAALRRELDEELGATVGAVRQVFVMAEQTPVGDYLSTFYVCRLASMDPTRRHGPEFEDPARGRYDIERFPCTPEALAGIGLRPALLAGYLRANITDLPNLVPSPYR